VPLSREVPTLMSHARPLLAAALTAAAIAAAGCGSSGDEHAGAAKAPVSTAAAKPAAPATSTATGPRPSKATYIRRADAVCREAGEVGRSANAVVHQAFAKNDSTAAAQAIDNYMPLFAKHVERLKALRQPTANDKVLVGLLKVMDGQVQALRAEVVALRKNDAAALQTINKAQQQEHQFAEALGSHYGFKVCGRSA
jgi:hypothetical protein